MTLVYNFEVIFFQPIRSNCADPWLRHESSPNCDVNILRFISIYQFYAIKTLFQKRLSAENNDFGKFIYFSPLSCLFLQRVMFAFLGSDKLFISSEVLRNNYYLSCKMTKKMAKNLSIIQKSHVLAE